MVGLSSLDFCELAQVAVPRPTERRKQRAGPHAALFAPALPRDLGDNREEIWAVAVLKSVGGMSVPHSRSTSLGFTLDIPG